VVDNPCNRGVCNRVAFVHRRRDGRRQGGGEMVTVGQIFVVLAIVCGGMLFTGGLVLVAWYTDQKKGGEG